MMHNVDAENCLGKRLSTFSPDFIGIDEEVKERSEKMEVEGGFPRYFFLT